MNNEIKEWGTPISKDKIIYRRNKLIELAKVEATPYTIWYETVNENILDINYMIYEIERLNNTIKDIKDYVNFLVIINQTINGKFSETQWGQDILGLIGDDNE